MIGIFISLIAVIVLIPNFNDYMSMRESEKEEKAYEKEKLSELEQMYKGNFIDLVSKDELDLESVPSSIVYEELLTDEDLIKFKKLDKDFSKLSALYNEIIKVAEEIAAYDIMNDSASSNGLLKKDFEKKVDSLRNKVDKLPENQAELFKRMIADMQTEFYFYYDLYPTYIGSLHNFKVDDKTMYLVFSDEKIDKIIQVASDKKPQSPVGFIYFGLNEWEKNANKTKNVNDYKEAKFYNEYDSDIREGLINSFWKKEGNQYNLYLTNVSKDYIKFAKESFLIYYDFREIYFHTNQFHDTRSGLDELNRISYDEKSRSGYRWTVFTLGPNKTKKIGSLSAEKFEKISYDGQLRYRYDDKKYGMGGVPIMSE